MDPKRASKTAKSVDEYIRQAPAQAEAHLRRMRELVREIVPGAEERISYQMPAYFLKSVVVYFGAFTKHVGLYPTASGVSRFEKKLGNYRHTTGAIQFPLDEPLPEALIREIVAFRAREAAR